MKKFEFEVDGNKIELEAKSHAGIFRDFWAHFFNEDLDKTIDVIEMVDIRTSNSDLFIAKNGSKKKNIPVPGGLDLYIYTHLSPSLMQKAYDKFLKGWSGEWEREQEAKAALEAEKEQAKKEKAEKKKAEKEAKVKEKESKPEAKPEEPAQEEAPDNRTPEEIGKDEISEEMYGTPYSELLPAMKGVVSKKYKKQLEEAK